MDLWPHQSRGLELLRAAAPKYGRVLVVCATGGGKTVLGAEVCAGASARNNRVLWVAHTTELIDQPVAAFRERGLRVGIIQADRPRDTAAAIQVATFQTLARREIEEYEIVVFDEVHLHVGTKTTAKILAANPRAQVLGLTATPWKLSGEPMGSVFNHLINLATYAELIALGVLVPSRVFAPSRPDLSKVHIVGGEFDQQETEDEVNTPALRGDVVSTYSRVAWTPYGHRQAIVFAHSIEHSLALCDDFCASGHRAEHLDYRTPQDVRRDMIERFKAGEIDVLCNKDILTAGFDYRGLGCVIDASPTRSLARYMQRIGRGMRSDPGKHDLLVHDHSGNVFQHGFAHTDREWTLDDARSTPKSTVPPLRTCPKCFAVFPPEEICPECGYVFPVESRNNKLMMLKGELEEIKTVETNSDRARRKVFMELCAVAISIKAGRAFVNDGYRRRFGGTPRFAWPDELPENLQMKRAKLEGFARSRGYSSQWVDQQMGKKQ